MRVDYEPLPSVVSVRQAIEAHEFQGAQPTVERGDVAAGVEESEHVFSGVFEFSGQEHFYLETHCALAHVDEGGQVFVQSSTQHPSETQEIVAHVLGLPANPSAAQLTAAVSTQADDLALIDQDVSDAATDLATAQAAFDALPAGDPSDS